MVRGFFSEISSITIISYCLALNSGGGEFDLNQSFDLVVVLIS